MSADGSVVGEGFTRRKPGPHAEDDALAQAGDRARGSTVYTTLEPCNTKKSKLASCAQLLIDAGVRRVVASVADPCPDVDGRGFAMLRDAGIEVEVGPGAAEATRLIEPFTKWMHHDDTVRHAQGRGVARRQGRRRGRHLAVDHR